MDNKQQKNPPRQKKKRRQRLFGVPSDELQRQSFRELEEEEKRDKHGHIHIPAICIVEAKSGIDELRHRLTARRNDGATDQIWVWGNWAVA